MANPDRPKGFTPVKTVMGHPWTALVRRYPVADGADIFRGDAVTFSSGRVATASTNGVILGVAVGFGRDVTGNMGDGIGPFDPQNLENAFYDDSESTHTEWYAWVVPAEGVLFECQTASALSLTFASAADLVNGGGNATTGASGMELTTSTNADVKVVENPEYPDNDITLTNARHWVMFNDTEHLAAN